MLNTSLLVSCVAAILASCCFGGALSINSTCETGNCITPDTLAIGASTTISGAFNFTLPNGDMYQVSTYFPTINNAPGGFFGTTLAALTEVTYLGNGSAGSSALDTLTIHFLQNLQSNSQFIPSVNGGSYSIFAVLGGGIGSGSSISTQYTDGFLSGSTAPLVGPGSVSDSSTPGTFSGTMPNPTFYDAEATETFQAGSLVGSFIESSFAAASALSDLQGGTTSAPIYLVSAGTIGLVTGSIGAEGSEDYYFFSWNGGAFSATAAIPGAAPAASYLFSMGAAGGCNSAASGTLNSTDSFSSTLSVANLAPSQYCIGLDANSSSDPMFSLTFNTPVETATPEPATMTLLSVGLGTICVRRLRRRK